MNTIVRRQAKQTGVKVTQERAQATPMSVTAHAAMPCEARHPCRQQYLRQKLTVNQYLRQLSSEHVSGERMDTPKSRDLCQEPAQ